MINSCYLLVEQLEETNQEHEQERQQWKEAKKVLERSVIESSGAHCECDALRSKVTTLEAALKEKGKAHLRREAEIRRCHQPIGPLLKKLPIVEVIRSVEYIVVASGGPPPSPECFSQLSEAFTASPASRQDSLVGALLVHLDELARIGVHIGDRLVQHIWCLLSYHSA